MGVSTVGRSMLATAVPLFAVALGMAPLWLGVVVALPNALPVVLGVPAGRWIDRGGAPRWLMIGTGGMASAPLALLAAPGVAVLAVAQLALGTFQLFAVLAAQAMVADRRDTRSLERDYASYSTLVSAGRLAGPLLAGLAIDASGFASAFALAGAMALASFGLALATRRRGATSEPPERNAEATDEAPATSPDLTPSRSVDGGLRAGIRDAWRQRGVRFAVLAGAGVFVAIAARQAFLPVVLEDLGFSATAVGALLSLGALASVSVRPFMPWVARRLGSPSRTLLAATTVVAAAVGLLGTVDSFAAFAALSVTAGLATGVGLPLSIVTVARSVAPPRRGAALGLRLASNRAAQLAAPIAVGAVVGVAGFAAGFALVGVVVAGMAWGAVRSGRGPQEPLTDVGASERTGHR